MYRNNELDKLEAYLNNAKNWKHNDKIDKIKSIYKEYNKEYNNYSTNYKNVIETSFDRAPFANHLSFFRETDPSKPFILTNLQIDNMVNDINDYINRLESINIFSILKNKTSPVVFIGPNGSGKTTLLNKLRSFTGNTNVGYFSADRLNVSAFKSSYARNNEEFFRKFRKNNEDASDYNNINRTDNIIRQFSDAIDLFQRSRSIENDEKESGKIKSSSMKTNKILKKWNSLIQTRVLFSHGELNVKTKKGKKYSIDNLSNGEKSILYFLSSIMLDTKKDFYFIDEPENSLHPLVVAELWDYLESCFPDSIFVYLTHDSNFADSRENSIVYWIKEYDGENNWNYELLQKPKEIPKELLVSLLGEKKPMIVCESNSFNSLDCRIYKTLFPDFSIYPVGSCDKVKEISKGYEYLNKPNACYGIIDCDYKSESLLNGLEKHKIYHLPFFEIECFFVCEEIFIKAIQRGSDKNNIITDYKNMLLKNLIKNKKKWIANKVMCDLYDSSFCLNKKSEVSVESVKNEFKEYISNIDIDKKACDLDVEFDNILKSDNINDFLRVYDDKNIIQDVSSLLGYKSKSDYINKVIQLLKQDRGLIKAIKNKYLAQIQ